MRAIPYKAKSGRAQYRPEMTNEELEEERTTGFCLACGHEQGGIEPDARKLTCEHCHEPKLYGLEELAVMGLVKITA